jgi:hypothetical protein
MGVVIGASVTVSVMAVAVVGASAVTVTAVAVGTACGGGIVGSVEGPHPERLNSMVRQATTAIFLNTANLRVNF